jgi:mono/diheme cytochrome c family protein
MDRRRALTAASSIVAAAALLAACGEERIQLSAQRGDDARMRNGARLFVERCSGCHTLAAAGTQGSSASVVDNERTDGPNFNVRRETVDQVLYAIRNGGYSGAIMPQNLVVGRDAQDVSRFVAAYAGTKAKQPPTPEQARSTQPSGGRVPERSDPDGLPESGSNRPPTGD